MFVSITIYSYKPLITIYQTQNGREKYKEGNNHPSSVNQKSLVHKHDKAGNKCYTPDNTDTRGKPKCVKMRP